MLSLKHLLLETEPHLALKAQLHIKIDTPIRTSCKAIAHISQLEKTLCHSDSVAVSIIYTHLLTDMPLSCHTWSRSRERKPNTIHYVNVFLFSIVKINKREKKDEEKVLEKR